tara:strand:- start:373 stop:1125 length:753 start_codon:yes stop_codon:yes gene_type:complete
MSSKGVTRDSWIILKQAWNISNTPSRTSLECGNSNLIDYKNILVKYFGFANANEESMGIYCLIARHNADEMVDTKKNPFEVLGPKEVLIPNIYRYDVEFIDDEYDFENYYDACILTTGISSRYEIECECLSAIKEGYDEEGEYYEEDCLDDVDIDSNCECTDYEEPVVELYRWNYSTGTYYSTNADIQLRDNQTGEIDNFLGENVITLYEHGQGEYTEWETYDYFDDSREGEVLDWQMEDASYEIERTVK